MATLLSAKDLLFTYLDYATLWSSADRKDARPAVLRRKQIAILLQALGIRKEDDAFQGYAFYQGAGKLAGADGRKDLASLTQIEYFEGGEFLSGKHYQDYRPVVGAALKAVKALNPNLPHKYLERHLDIYLLFGELLELRKKVRTFTNTAPRFVMGFSAAYAYSEILAEDFKRNIEAQAADIDETLCLIIDPFKQRLPKEQLVKDYDYPDVSIDQEDLDWFIKHV